MQSSNSHPTYKEIYSVISRQNWCEDTHRNNHNTEEDNNDDIESLDGIEGCFDCEEKDKELQNLRKAFFMQQQALQRQTSRADDLEKQVKSFNQILTNELPKLFNQFLLNPFEDVTPLSYFNIKTPDGADHTNASKQLFKHVATNMAATMKRHLDMESKLHAKETVELHLGYQQKIHQLQDDVDQKDQELNVLRQKLSEAQRSLLQYDTNQISYEDLKKKCEKYKKLAVYLKKMNDRMTLEIDSKISEWSIDYATEVINEASERGDLVLKIEKKASGSNTTRVPSSPRSEFNWT